MKHHKLYRIRSARASDAMAIYELSKQAKSGLSNLPKKLKDAEELVQLSISSKNESNYLTKRQFIFVLENNKGQVLGLSGIKARTGIYRPYYSFILHKIPPYPYLELVKQRLGPSELGSLFLAPEARGKGLGRLLSLSRFLFIKKFSQFFTPTIIAELRGFLFKNNVSPIWNTLGKKFINSSFHKADISASKDLDFIEKKFPKQPIYLNLLEQRSIQYFKKVHPNTEPAKQLLMSENFKITNHVDIFDGGPKLECLAEKIRTINKSQIIKASQLSHFISKSNYLICNQTSNEFSVIKSTPKTSIETIKKQLNIINNDEVTIVKERDD
ncbi:MAG: arginine N-succinyltransferase [Candidatus Margulisiibacteriota bacterium]|nr:arginine N-succinyltransferase [Candidatus Margulisiibacteriota bacterium]